MATLFGDFLNGVDANAGNTFANRFKSWTNGATAARTAPGDVIRWMKSPDPTTLGSCTWTNNSASVTIPAGTILDVDTCEGAWTSVSANVTQSNTTTAKQGTNSLSLAIAAGFTTGTVAYLTLPGTLNCSSYDTLSMCMRLDASSIAANTFRVDLCSDTLGATPVDSFTINFATPSTTGIFGKIVISKGSALGSSIRSIALVALLDPGAVTVILDNIIVSKSPSSADCLTHASLIAISSSPTGFDHWYAIKAITGTTVTLETLPNSLAATAGKLYMQPTVTATTYVRQPILVPQLGVGVLDNSTNESGTLGNPIMHSGGWNTTDMTTQTGETFISPVFGNTPSVMFNILHSYISMEKISLCSGSGFSSGSGSGVTNFLATDCHFIGSTGSFAALAGGMWYFTRCHSNGGSPTTSNNFGGYEGTVIWDDCHCCALSVGGTTGMFNLNSFVRCIDCTASGGNSFGFYITSDIYGVALERCKTKGNATAGVGMKLVGGSAVGNNCELGETDEVAHLTTSESAFYSENHDGVQGACNIDGNRFLITTDASVRHTASGNSWKVAVISTLADATFPAKFLIGTRYMPSGVAVAVKVWARRTNTGLTVSLVVPKYAGVITTAGSASMTAIADTWEQLSVSVTPAADGVVEVWGYCYGGSTFSGYFDDLSFT